MMNTLSQPAPLVLLLLLASVLFALPSVTAGQGHMKNEVAFYIATYGEVLPAQDLEVARAHRIFDRVRGRG